LFLKHLYISNRFYLIGFVLFALLTLSFFFKFLYIPALVVCVLFALLVLADAMLLFFLKNPIKSERSLKPILSLSDPNVISLKIQNLTPFPLHYQIVEELPEQLQIRDFELLGTIKGMGAENLQYEIVPKVRGLYKFGQTQVFLSTFLSLLKRRYPCGNEQTTPVFPSIIQMQQYQLYSIQKLSKFYGLKKLRRIGHSYEFEQIKEYVLGDDIRSLNWKATGRKGSLMVNHYQEEKSQQVYCVIDKSRNMLMPFNGLSLMDYAINSSLVISNVALQKGDKAGLLTFSNKIGNALKAESGSAQLRKILNLLYSQKERDFESDFNLLFYSLKKMAPSRSLLFLFTNFESVYAMHRVLPTLRMLNSHHLLVVIFFENEEIAEISHTQAGSKLEDVYKQTIAAEFIHDKLKIKQELQNFGIQTLLTKPKDLTINSLNKYLELKARGMI
jgi:uncharacterized protein (DUF58 family)